MGKWTPETSRKNLEGLVRPELTRDEFGQVVSIGIAEGQEYYQVSQQTKKVTSKLDFEPSKRKTFNDLGDYIQVVIRLIESGCIYIEAEEEEPEEKPEEPNKDNQLSMF